MKKKKLNVPCFLRGTAKGLLGKENLVHFRHCSEEALKEADLVILAGKYLKLENKSY